MAKVGTGTTTGTIVDDPSKLATTNAGDNATIIAKLKDGETDLTGVL